MGFAPLGGLLAFLAAATATWLARSANRARHERAAVLPSGLIPGAEPVALDGGRKGVLILHGFGDTPQSVRGLAEVLHSSGWTVRAPVLHGHGSSVRAFTAARAHHWLADARSELDRLQARSAPVAIVGQSMGGALATLLAAEARVDALVLLAPYLTLSTRASWIAAFHPVVSLITPYLRSRSESSILDPVARSHALGRGITTPRLLHELSLVVREASEAAPRVRAPTLVIHSHRDPRIPASAAEAAFARLGAPTKLIEWAGNSGHVLSVDHDREWVAQRTLDWLEAHARPRLNPVSRAHDSEPGN